MKNLTYDDIINRLASFRTKANLSGRETSLRLGYTEQFIKRIENKTVELKVKTLLEFCEVVGISIYDFIYLGDKFNSEDKYFLEMFSGLSNENRQLVLNMMKNLK